MFKGTVRLVQEPKVRTPKHGGDDFVTGRCAYERREMNRSLGTTVKHTTFMNLIAFGEAATLLFEMTTGELVFITGEIESENYTKKDGTPGTGFRCVVASALRPPAEEPAQLPEAGPEDEGYVLSLTQDAENAARAQGLLTASAAD